MKNYDNDNNTYREVPYTGRPYNSGKYNGKRFFRRHVMNVKLCVPSDIDVDTYNSIIDILTTAPFDRLSYNLVCPRYLINPTVDNNKKTSVIGYINSYDSSNCEFTVAIFDGPFTAISKLDDIRIEVNYITRRDGTTMITHIKLVGDPKEEYENDDDEDEEEEDNTGECDNTEGDNGMDSDDTIYNSDELVVEDKDY